MLPYYYHAAAYYVPMEVLLFKSCNKNLLHSWQFLIQQFWLQCWSWRDCIANWVIIDCIGWGLARWSWGNRQVWNTSATTIQLSQLCFVIDGKKCQKKWETLIFFLPLPIEFAFWPHNPKVMVTVAIYRFTLSLLVITLTAAIPIRSLTTFIDGLGTSIARTNSRFGHVTPRSRSLTMAIYRFTLSLLVIALAAEILIRSSPTFINGLGTTIARSSARFSPEIDLPSHCLSSL